MSTETENMSGAPLREKKRLLAGKLGPGAAGRLPSTGRVTWSCLGPTEPLCPHTLP